MPSSPLRKNKQPTETKPGRAQASGPGLVKRYAAPVMVTLWLLGLIWVVVFYIAGNQIPGMAELGNWNLLIGMGLIAAGFIFATQWE
ncbi:MAG: cell division protein CrgA [Nocardioidaceae bacterium]|nr:cell division protein CrgA [Nocardioidaceae bacterium]MDQ3325133.1 cell division protein CrgA [Actinomycetota bacterium]MDQ3416021.1 cell division protein CrgA [Actinomycetota bacterium]